MNASTLIAGLAWLGCAACAWVPDSGQYACDRGTIDPAVRVSFAPGNTTRADVLCQLGEPDWISDDEARFAYQTLTIDSYFFIYLVGGLGVYVWGDVVSELFEFDGRGVLLRHRSVQQPYGGGGDGGPNWSPASPAELQVLFEEHAGGAAKTPSP